MAAVPGRQHRRRYRVARDAHAAGRLPFLRAIVTCAFMLALGLMIHVTAVPLWAGCLLALVVVLLPLLSGRGRRNAGR
jgi:putative copper export protein